MLENDNEINNRVKDENDKFDREKKDKIIILNMIPKSN